MVAKIAGDHVRVRVSTDDSTKTEVVSHYMGPLRAAVIEAGWKVDEVAYATREDIPHAAVSQSVIEHIVSQDSLNRLM